MNLETPTPSPNFTLWPLVVKVPPPSSHPLSPINQLGRGLNRTLDYLRESNLDLESIVEKLGVPKTKSFLMQELLEIEFKEQLGEILISLCPRKLTSCIIDLRVPLSLKSRNSTISLNPLVGVLKPTPVGKEKGTKRKASSQNPNFIIWNAQGANSVEFCRHCTSMVKLHNLLCWFCLKQGWKTTNTLLLSFNLMTISKPLPLANLVALC